MRKLVLFFISLVIILSCSDSDGVNNFNTENVVVSSGTSFGMCAGYCNKEIEIQGSTISYTKKSWDTANYPFKSVSFELTSAEQRNIYNSLDFKTLSKMQNQYGCPDCADGGAEWIEISKDGYYKKIIFEYGTSLKEIEPLLTNLRTIRKKFDDIAN